MHPIDEITRQEEAELDARIALLFRPDHAEAFELSVIEDVAVPKGAPPTAEVRGERYHLPNRGSTGKRLREWFVIAREHIWYMRPISWDEATGYRFPRTVEREQLVRSMMGGRWHLPL